MALKSLEGVQKIGGYDVVVMDELQALHPERFTETGAMDHKWFEETIRPTNFVYVRNDKNSLSFTLQNGPVKEVGVNGCQVDTIIHAAKAILRGLNTEFPCRGNSLAITRLEEALYWLAFRKRDREERGVEGKSEA